MSPLGALFDRPPRMIRRAKYSPDFLEAMQGRTFQNPETKQENQFESLPSEEQQRIHQLWERARQQPQEITPPQRRIPEEALKATSIVSNQDPDRYKGVEIEYGGLGDDPEETRQQLHRTVGNAASRAGMTPEQYVMDLAGGGGITGMLKSMKIRIRQSHVFLEGSGDQIEDMEREISFDFAGRPSHIRNVHLHLTDDAPPGTATRMLATQVASLKAAGGQSISATAAGTPGSDYKGYYVWPLLGFDGRLPDNDVSQLPRKIREEIIDTGGGPPFYISELMSFQKGRDWWLENGGEIELSFHVDNDEVLQKYIARKAQQAGKAVGQWIHNASKKQQRNGMAENKLEKIEQAPKLDKDDLQILGEIWDNVPKSHPREKDKMTPQKSTRALIDFAKTNTQFRTALFKELVKKGNINWNIRDFTNDAFSQHQMLHNLREGDLIEILYEPNPEHPTRVLTRLVASDFDPDIPGVTLQGGSGQEILASRDQDAPVLWEPGNGEPAFPVIQLKIVHSKLGADKTTSSSQILVGLGGTERLVSLLGARNLKASANGLCFEWPNRRIATGNKVAISEVSESGYHMAFYRKTASGEDLVQQYKVSSVGELAKTFETHTGWFLRV